MPAITTRGAASAKAFGWSSGGGPGPYIEEVFSTFLYTGTGATQTITNNLDLSTKGGMVWLKSRSAAYSNALFDTSRGTTKALFSDTTGGTQTYVNSVTAFNSTGFTMGSETLINQNTATFCSWTFREQPKFFDVVTYTGTGSNTTIAHALGLVPGCIIIKRTDTTADWAVYHRSLANTQYLVLNTTAAAATGATWWNSTTPTSSVFSVGTDASVNASGGTYVAYLFAHNAGGFGLTGADNVISCESYTGNGSATGPVVTLGYEPQWVMIKNASSTGNWVMQDVMRGMPVGGNTMTLFANLSNAESDPGISRVQPTATGFQLANTASGDLNTSAATYIYIAVRRGPMKVPTVGTSVFAPQLAVGDASASGGSIGFPADLFITAPTAGAGYYWYDRLRGSNGTSLLYLTSTLQAAASSASDNPQSLSQNTVTFPAAGGYWNSSGVNFSRLNFRRAPGFFDEVCYTGTGIVRTISHNLTVAPELMISKTRDTSNPWQVWTSYFSYLSGTAPSDYCTAVLNGSQAFNGYSESTSISALPTASVFSLGTQAVWNGSGNTAVMYLFASCPGVSKVGSYTGNGSNQTIACGFAAGSRFVMIKRTDSAGDWYVWDSARGIVAGNDPHLSLNDVAAQVSTDDSVDTDNSGFIVNQLAATNVNVTSATYIFLAIA